MTVAFNLSQLANYVNSSGKLDAANGLVNATPVANGGTGAASTTAYAVQCGGTTSTGAHQAIASVGTTGQILTSNGAAALPTFQAPASSGFTNIAVYTSSGNWSVPSGVTKAKVTVVGGGGGGGNDNSNEAISGGGGGGTAIEYVTGLSGTVSVTVGAGGAQGSTGATGGTSSFGAYCSASGGTGGISYGGFGPVPAPGNGGAGSGGSINISGGLGAASNGPSTGAGISFMSAGAGQLYGGGGNRYTDGAAGIVFIEY